MAGVGVGTVSRVLNSPEKVSPKLRDRVLQVIAATNFRPSSAARTLVHQQFQTIGLISEIEHERTYYFASLVQGVSHALMETQHRMALGMVHTNTEADALREVSLLSAHSVDALILDLHQLNGDVDNVMASVGLPYVWVNPSGAREFNAVQPNDVASGRGATEYLLSHGHRSIAYVPPPKEGMHSSHADRFRGYLEAMSDAGFQPLPAWGPSGSGGKRRADSKGRRLAKLMKSQRVTALVCYDGVCASGLLRTCYEADVRVPTDLSLIACDDDPILERTVVPVSAMRLDRYAMGRTALEMALARAGSPDSPLQTRVCEPVLQERESVADRADG